MNDDSRPLLPEPPHDPRAFLERPEPEPVKPNWWPLAGAVVVLVVLLFAIKAGIMDAPATPRNATPSPIITAPSDEVVQTELERQLEVFQTQGGQAANARLQSYRAGLRSAGCDVEFGIYPSNPVMLLETPEQAAAQADSFVGQQVVAEKEKGNTVGSGFVTLLREDGQVSGYGWAYLLVTCP